MLNKSLLILLLCLLPHDAQFASVLCSDAIILAKQKEYTKAKELFLQAIALNPYYYLAHYGYGKMCLYTGDIMSAIIHLNKAVRLDNMAASSWFYLGFAYFFAKKYITANHCFLKAYQLNSSFIESLYNIGVIYEITGDSLKSKLYFDKYFLEKNKKNTGVLF